MINQWGKLMVVVLVYQYHLHSRIAERIGQFQATEASTHNHYSFRFCLCNVKTHTCIS